MKFLNLTVLICLMGSVSWATQTATQPISAVQCPATSDTVKAFRNKLLELKSAITNSANCKEIKDDISHLDSLLTKDRPQFVDLIAQGQTEGLSEVDQGTVKNYVDDLTVTTYNILAVVTGHDACFAEDKKGSSMQFLSSLIGEGTKLLAVAGGPELGPIIGIAGEAVTGFMSAMQTISSEQIGYDFSKDEQQIAYADNLCTLFDSKRELNTMVNSAESVSRLQLLKASIQKQVDALAKSCSECNELKGMVDSQISRAVTDDNGIATTDAVWPKDFEAQVIEKAKQIDAQYTNPIGTQMYRELRTLSWIPLRIEALRADDFSTDIVLSSAIGEMESIEEFLIKDQAPKYMDSLIRDAEESLWKLNDIVNAQVNVLARNGGEYLNPYNGISILAGQYSSAEDFYSRLFIGLDKVRNTTQDQDVQGGIEEFFSDLDSKSRYVDIKLDVFDKYCAFFQQSRWGWQSAGIGNICNDSYVRDLKQQALLLANYRLLMAANNGVIDLQVKDPVVAKTAPDWSEALRESIIAQPVDAKYVERKAN